MKIKEIYICIYIYGNDARDVGQLVDTWMARLHCFGSFYLVLTSILGHKVVSELNSTFLVLLCDFINQWQ